MDINLMTEEDRIDPGTGILLTPGFHGEDCLGNGLHSEYECCCDECDYLLECFPDWEQLTKENYPTSNK